MNASSSKQIAALLVAAGRGQRAGGGTPKQWRPLAGRVVADITLAAFRAAGVTRCVIVLHPDDMNAHAPRYSAMGCKVVPGGQDRAGSVRNGLAALDGSGATHVLIHDIARPCVSPALIGRVIAALDTAEAAAPALPVTDALWTGADKVVTGTQDRTGLYRAQTPQGFALPAIRAAHAAHPGGAADDVEVARAAGIAVAIVDGEADNIKITTPGDFARAERILRGPMTIRLGNGYDVHAFGPGSHVTLCGIDIPHTHGLVGHSDADVAMHTITDAIYGALAEGDIGRHFPPSDPQWKGAASEIFLRHATELAAARGYDIANIDCTIICELPKIGPHADAMRTRLAQIMGLEDSAISVKATTSEKLGFTGRGEGIACIATAALCARGPGA